MRHQVGTGCAPAMCRTEISRGDLFRVAQVPPLMKTVQFVLPWSPEGEDRNKQTHLCFPEVAPVTSAVIVLDCVPGRERTRNIGRQHE